MAGNLDDIESFLLDHESKKNGNAYRVSRNSVSGHSEVPAPYYIPYILLDPRQSTYHASSRGTRSTSTSTSHASHVSNVFDTLDDHRSSYSASTAPLPRGPQPHHHQPPPVAVAPTLSWLPCEFARWVGCTEAFPLDRVDDWTNHIIEVHLRGQLPDESICWFCDHTHFGALSDSPEQREAAFRRRMHHIATHIQQGWQAAERRPDFYFLKHLHRHSLIHERVFERECRHGELSKLKSISIRSTPPLTPLRGDAIVEDRRHYRRMAAGRTQRTKRDLLPT